MFVSIHHQILHTQHIHAYIHTHCPPYFHLVRVADPGAPPNQVSSWPLIAMVCAPDDAAALRVALFHSSKLKEMLWATLEGILADNDKLRKGPLDVRLLVVGTVFGSTFRRAASAVRTGFTG
jgi:hypothetical protein